MHNGQPEGDIYFVIRPDIASATVKKQGME